MVIVYVSVSFSVKILVYTLAHERNEGLLIHEIAHIIHDIC